MTQIKEEFKYSSPIRFLKSDFTNLIAEKHFSTVAELELELADPWFWDLELELVRPNPEFLELELDLVGTGRNWNWSFMSLYFWNWNWIWSELVGTGTDTRYPAGTRSQILGFGTGTGLTRSQILGFGTGTGWTSSSSGTAGSHQFQIQIQVIWHWRENRGNKRRMLASQIGVFVWMDRFDPIQTSESELISVFKPWIQIIQTKLRSDPNQSNYNSVGSVFAIRFFQNSKNSTNSYDSNHNESAYDVTLKQHKDLILSDNVWYNLEVTYDVLNKTILFLRLLL
ncbi:hypothetical protein LXL04_037066 [Taraxacum kok-saghyz]